MTPIRRAIVRAAPTCTLWGWQKYRDHYAFRPVARFQNGLMYYGWTHNSHAGRLALRLGAWLFDKFRITRAELFVAGADVSHLEG